MHQYQTEFLDFAIKQRVLRFGEFTLKSGRISPYFFNAGLFNSGETISKLGRFYAAAMVSAGLEFDILFGPAYKGIPLAATTAIALFEKHNRNVPWCFNRKEAKDHGEGGHIVGAPLQGRVAIVDDVITAGTAIREVMTIIMKTHATPAAVVVAMDRQEKGRGEPSAVDKEPSAVDKEPSAVDKEPSAVDKEPSAVDKEPSAVDKEPSAINQEPSVINQEPSTMKVLSAIQEVERDFNIPVLSIVSLTDLLEYTENHAEFRRYAPDIKTYRDQYGI